MSISAQCPFCRRRQSIKNKMCACGADLDKAKKAHQVVYWIDYYLPSGKRRREPAGKSIKDAQAAEGKKRGLKKENRLFDILPEEEMTFRDLTDWYLKLEKVKALASYPIIEVYLNKFNAEFGDLVVGRIMPEDLENLVERRKKQGCADGTIDQEIGKVKAMVAKAFDNDKVSGDTLKKFKKIKKRDKGNVNARTRILSPDEFNALLDAAPLHLRSILMTGYHTGMREGEILKLTWDKIDKKKRVIRLAAADTKDREPRTIPISDALYRVFDAMPRAIHDRHVFLFQGKSAWDLRQGLRKACAGARIVYGRFKKGGFVFHDLRHTFNTNMRRAGVPESVIMKITGHSTRSMFDRYNTVDEGDLRQAIEKMEEVM